MDEGRHYYLSRPRRFGKSLFLDTLKELFEGTEALFAGLHIHDRGDWDWSVRHPVVRLDFAGGSFKDPGYLQISLTAQLDGMEVASGVRPRYDTPPERFGYLTLYRLDYPNREVRQSLNRVLLRHLVQDAERQTANSIRLARLLATHDCAGLKELFHAFFASIPYQWYTNNQIARYEGFYASVVYS